ncbi:MAG: carbohydrate kinase family protein [Acholeplasmataceae bacterium]|nr:carbohydrate kinase family protein [Acholeplasmataceae bacterium]
MRYLVIGTSAYDTLIHTRASLEHISEDMMIWADNVVHTIGSTGAGKALALDALGADVDLISDLADDEAGKWITSYLSSTNIRSYPVLVDQTTTHTNIMHGDRKRISIQTSTPSVVADLHRDAESLIAAADLVFLNINQYCRAYIPIIKAKNKKTLVDIHDYAPTNPYHQAFIEAADILVSSGVNISDHEGFLREQIEKGKQLVVITKGKDGLVALDHEKKRVELPGYNSLPYVDGNGAGDSFCAGLGMMLSEGKSNLEALLFATICGGVACTDYPLFNRSYDRKAIETIFDEFQVTVKGQSD